MSTLLTAASKAEAQAYCDKAHAWRQANVARYNATKWADPFQHPTDGTWAMPFDPLLPAAFTTAELGAQTTKDAAGKDIVTNTKVAAWTADWNAPVAKAEAMPEAVKK